MVRRGSRREQEAKYRKISHATMICTVGGLVKNQSWLQEEGNLVEGRDKNEANFAHPENQRLSRDAELEPPPPTQFPHFDFHLRVTFPSLLPFSLPERERER
ncbi:hypothetical protein SAY86_008755 [Trapa natans]|uniref:Uncharacterized protein n=1 Tax=Trapa natans TaxID=22666 RepID=A0AAN7KAS0_TRANT|nr:hypothetical protein SAY86_008755 [Trapa natans]